MPKLATDPSGPDPDLPTEPLRALSLDAVRDALLLDFDGTLVDIAPRPDAISFTEADARLLATTSAGMGGAVAVVSGRDLGDVAGWLGAFDGTVSGGHGAQLRRDGQTTDEVAYDATQLTRVRQAVTRFAADHPKVRIENKTHGVVLHFREHPAMESPVRAFADTVLAEAPDFALQPAKMAIEIKPAAASKAAAIERILAAPPFKGRRPVYAGDDTTDETAFAHVTAAGGAGIKIGDGRTAARYRTDSPDSFKRWLAAQTEKWSS